MDFMLLTQNSTPIFKYVVKLLGLIMNGIFEFLNLIGIPNIGLSIILFTIVIYLLLMPLTVKQQRFSKLSARMNPELQVIRDKYKGRQDQEAMMAMKNETDQIYAKYGVFSFRKLCSAFDSDADFACVVPCYLCDACICYKDRRGVWYSSG